MAKSSAAIVGTGNIGTDLLYKLLRSTVLEPRWMIGIDPESDGLRRARERGVEASAEGVPWLLAQRELPDLVFEATSAAVHRAHAPLYEEAGIRVIDLTPAALGPSVVPPVNLAAHRDAPNVNLITCGGQATIPIVHAVARVVTVDYAEIVSTVASVSAGPGTRANIDEFTRTTARGVEVLGGAQVGKAIIVLNPADPPIIMRNTVFCAVPADIDEERVAQSILDMVDEVQTYVPGYRLRSEPQFDEPEPDRRRVSAFLEVEGAGDYLPAYAGNLDIMTAAAAKVGEQLMAPAEVGRVMPYSDELDIRITDSCLRDGSHAKRHRFTVEDVTAIVAALDRSGVPVIEVSHGDGLGGSSFNYGFSLVDERKLIAAAVAASSRAKIACLMLPGVGVKDDIHAAHDLGASVIRIATHCTEADIAIQHFRLAREIGIETVGFLMMAHSVTPGDLARQARVMADAGCECVYVVDSAGALVLDEVTDRVAALVDEIGGDAQVGFHGHQNLALGVANTILAIRAGAVQVDGSTRAFGAGSGNTPTEALVAVCERSRIRTGIDVFGIMDAAEDVVRPRMDGECVLDRLSLIMGYAGVYSSFLKHAYRLQERYGVSGAEILVVAGERKLVGGQEDQLIDVAIELAGRGE